MTVHDIELKGCAPVPLAHYLKALGILRLVAEQADPEARGYWRADTFVLRSQLDSNELLNFFIDKYVPTPVIVPWTGNDFFAVNQTTSSGTSLTFTKQPTAEKIIEAILATTSVRLDTYRKTIRNIFTAMEFSHTTSKEDITGNSPAAKKQKALFIQAIRNTVPEEVLFWIDAACAINDDSFSPNNLLGSGGGSDGNSHFSDTFMQTLWTVLPDFKNQRKDYSIKTKGGYGFNSSGALNQSLFGGNHIGSLIPKLSPVLFNPYCVGKANSTSGFEDDAASNPWDYIFMIEGSLLFAGNLTKKIGVNTPEVASFPFLLGMTPTGSAAVGSSDRSAKELWLPLWGKPVSIEELKQIFFSGRMEVHCRIASRGLDAMQAISQYGVDRGIFAFTRLGIIKGRAGGEKYFSAIDMGEFRVQRQPQVELLSDIDQWLETFRRKASSDKAPASAGRALRQLEEAILNLCKECGAKRVQDVLIALGQCEKTMVKSNKWATDRKNPIKPIPALSPPWLKEADDGSLELRLATSLASVSGSYKDNKGRHSIVPTRWQMEPVRTLVKNNHLKVDWNDEAGRNVVWSEGDPIKSMNAVMTRRIINAVKSGANTYPDRGRINADLGDIADFIEGRVDVQRVADLLWGLILVDWPAVKGYPLKRRDHNDSLFPGAAYGLLKLCFPGDKVQDIEIPIVPEIHRKSSVGDGVAATQLAIRRLRGSGLSAAMPAFDVSREQMERIAAALLFPLEEKQLETIASKVLRQIEEKED